MILDHIACVTMVDLPGVKDNTTIVYAIFWILRIIGRLSFPLFGFVLIEGICNTRSKTKYAIRMIVFALISEIPFDLTDSGVIFSLDSQNVMFTLFLAILSLCGYIHTANHKFSLTEGKIVKILYLALPAIYFSHRIDKYITTYSTINLHKYVLWALTWICCEILLFYTMKNFYERNGEEKALVLCTNAIILSFFMFVADLIRCDYSSIGILMISVMYIYRSVYQTRMLAGCLTLTALSSPLNLSSFLLVPIISKYNGQRGHKQVNDSLKYLFYLLYPVQFLILYYIKLCLNI